MENQKQILIHAIKAIQYRLVKATNGSKENFGNYKISPETRSPAEIINHMFDLTTKIKYMIKERHFNSPAPQLLDFAHEKERLLTGLEELQTAMSIEEIDIETVKKLL